MKRTITCMCETTFEGEFPEEVDIDEDPSLMGKIQDGSFLSVSCPSCGKTLKPEFEVLVRSAKASWYLVPELSRMDFYSKKIDCPKGARIAIGYSELAEKLLIAQAGLDESAIEFLKYYLYVKAEESNPAGEIEIRFKEISGDTISFYIVGLKADEIAITKIPRSLYETMRLKEKLEEEPFKEIAKAPYISVNKVLQAEAE
jgi:hypothetical protein